MSVSIEIPDDLYHEAAKIAEASHVPVGDVFASAFAEFLRQNNRIGERVQRGSREKFDGVLTDAPNAEPEERDPWG